MRPTSGKRGGFSLVEVMAAVAILGVGLVAVMIVVNSAKKTAYYARNIKAARNLATYLMGEVESGRIEKPFDGQAGDFASEGYPNFEYQIGIGEDTSVALASEDMRTDEEIRRAELDKMQSEREELLAETGEDEEEDMTDVEYLQIIVRVSYPSEFKEQPVGYVLVKMVPKSIIDGEFDNWKVSTASEGGDSGNE